jgi:hypothetical protein
MSTSRAYMNARRLAHPVSARPITERRKARQGGQEILEFALIALLLIPMLLGTFITGMNLVRSIQVNQMARDLTDMFIHGQDFSLYASQNLAKQLSQGLNLDIGADPGSAQWNNTANTNAGNGIIYMTEIMYVGATTDAQCVYVAPATCTNHDSFVYRTRVQFGSNSLLASHPSSLGTLPAGITVQSNGSVVNPVTDSTARLPTTAQAAMVALWQVNSGGQTPLVDGQLVYCGEAYFQSPDLSVSALSGSGVYSRYFF